MFLNSNQTEFLQRSFRVDSVRVVISLFFPLGSRDCHMVFREVFLNDFHGEVGIEGKHYEFAGALNSADGGTNSIGT